MFVFIIFYYNQYRNQFRNLQSINTVSNSNSINNWKIPEVGDLALDGYLQQVARDDNDDLAQLLASNNTYHEDNELENEDDEDNNEDEDNGDDEDNDEDDKDTDKEVEDDEDEDDVEEDDDDDEQNEGLFVGKQLALLVHAEEQNVTKKKGKPKEYDDDSDNKDVNHTGSIIITKKTDTNPDDKQFKKALLGNRTEVPCASGEKCMVNKIIKPFTSTHKCNCCQEFMCSYLCSVSKMEGEFLCYHCSFLNKETKLSSFNPKEHE
jgi:hypothetical protein